MTTIQVKVGNFDLAQIIRAVLKVQNLMQDRINPNLYLTSIILL